MRNEKKKIFFDIELKNGWIRQLIEDWRRINFSKFSNKMTLPEISLLDSNTLLGKWEGREKRKISINMNLIKTLSWQYVQEVLSHEMAHQYIEEVLWIKDALPHGEVFKRICVEKGIDPGATGDLNEWQQKISKNYIHSSGKKLDKIHKLLSLAQSSNNHEAELAMTMARELLLKHNLSLLEVDNSRRYLHKHIGEAGKGNPIRSMIGGILTSFFFVEAIWVYSYDSKKNKCGKILDIYGTAENIEMAEYVHDYLLNISEILWKSYKKENNLNGNINRRTFIYGLLNGFHKKLKRSEVENSTKDLVWTGDPGLKDYFKKRNPKISHIKSYYSKSCDKTYSSGENEGRNLVINKGIKQKNKKGCFLLG